MAVAQMRDGRWYCSFYYKDTFGNRRRKKKEGFRTKREAKRYEEQARSQYAGTCGMTFAAMNQLYLQAAQARMKASTLHTKQAVMQSKILPTFGDLRLCDITPLMIHQWQTQMIEKGYKPTYLRTINNILAAVFAYAERYYGLSDNPCRREPRMGRRNADAMKFWTAEQFCLALSAAKNDQVKLIFSLLFWTGMRKGECLALTPSDFNFSEKTVSITKTLTRIKSQNIITPPKTSRSVRTVTLPNDLCAQVQSYISRLYASQPNGLLFTRSPQTLDSDIIKAAAAAGVPRIRLHDLRHSHASLLIEMGFSPLLVSERLGHENADTTLRIYSHLYPNKQADVAAKLNYMVQK